MNSRGFQLSINMLVVIIIGLVLLGVGTSLFYKAYNHIDEAKKDVDKQSQSTLNALMDDGGILVVAFNSKDGKRGKYVDFGLGINNELGGPRNFKVFVTYGGTSADYDGDDPFNPEELVTVYRNYNDNNIYQHCGMDYDNLNLDDCGQAWVVMLSEFMDGFSISNNGRRNVPISINIPKSAKSGQYIFNVDVCVSDSEGGDADCKFTGTTLENRYGSRQKLYVNI